MNANISMGLSTAHLEESFELGMEALKAATFSTDNPNLDFLHDLSADPKKSLLKHSAGPEHCFRNAEEENNKDVTELEICKADDTLCSACLEHPCVYEVHEQVLTDYDDAQHENMTGNDVPYNDVRRKIMYRELTLILNCCPFGVPGIPKPLPTCCIAAICEKFPIP